MLPRSRAQRGNANPWHHHLRFPRRNRNREKLGVLACGDDHGKTEGQERTTPLASSHFVNAERRSAEKLAGLSASIVDLLGGAYKDFADRIGDEATRLEENLRDAYSYFSGLSQLTPTTECPRPTLEFEQSCLPEEFFVSR